MLILRQSTGAKLEAYNAVEHATGLLCIHQVHIHGAWIVYRFSNGRFGDLMENDALGIARVEAEYFAQGAS